MSKKRGNFDKLRAWINNSLPFTHFLVADGKRLLKFARDIERYNADVGLPAEIMKNKQLTSESAAVIRDILYANPKIGWASFPQLFNQFFVLMNGRAAKEHEFPSLPTIRNHVAQLDEFDRHEIRHSIKGLTEKLSPKGNRIFFGGGGDGTCHGKADKREVCMIVVPDNEFRDAKNPWKISPSFIVTTAGSPIGSDSVANSNHYLDSVERVVPPESLANFTVFGIDNCSTAKKDGRLTMEGAQERAVAHGHGDKTMIHDVKIRGFTIGDFFHRHQLSIKHFSETACGVSEKRGDAANEQIFHRQVSQHALNKRLTFSSTRLIVACYFLCR